MENQKDQPRSSSRQRKFLMVAGILELILLVPGALLVLFLGVKGYVLGEMGTMIGFFSTAILVFLVPYAVVRTLAVHGLRKKKRFAAIATIVLSLLLAAAVCSGIRDFPAFTVAVFLYAGLSILAAAICLKRPGFEKIPRNQKRRLRR